MEGCRESHIDELIRNLTNDDIGIAVAADQALRQLGKPAVGPLTEALKKSQGLAAQCIASILGLIGDAAAIEALCDTLNNDRNGLARSEAATALGRIGKPSVPYLIRALKHCYR